MKLTLFVGLYLLCTVAIGLFAATRVRSTTDYALAGRSLPLVMVITATFATWFGSETVLGLPGQFIKNGLEGVVEELSDRVWLLSSSVCSSPESCTE